MNNLLSAEFFKLFRRKSFYICITILLILIVISAYSMKFIIDREFISENDSEVLGLELSDISAASQLPATFTDSDTFSLLLAIIISLFICTDYSCGAIKNTCSRGYSRWKIYLSKLVAAWFTSAVFIVLSTIVRFLSYGIFFEFGTMTSDMVSEFLLICGLELLIYMALSSIFVFISTLAKNPGGAIAANISLSIFLVLILQILAIFNDSDINFMKYWLVSIGAEIGHYNINGDVIARVVVVALAYLAVFMPLGFLLFEKEDIKV